MEKEKGKRKKERREREKEREGEIRAGADRGVDRGWSATRALSGDTQRVVRRGKKKMGHRVFRRILSSTMKNNFENNLARDLFCGFLGCYKPTPLKMNLVLEIRLASKQMGKLLIQSVFAFPHSFFYSVSAPLNYANPYLRVSRPPGDGVQNLDWYFLISQVWLQIYRFYGHVFCLGYPQTSP